jgi:hypothetical protein
LAWRHPTTRAAIAGPTIPWPICRAPATAAGWDHGHSPAGGRAGRRAGGQVDRQVGRQGEQRTRLRPEAVAAQVGVDVLIQRQRLASHCTAGAGSAFAPGWPLVTPRQPS